MFYQELQLFFQNTQTKSLGVILPGLPTDSDVQPLRPRQRQLALYHFPLAEILSIAHILPWNSKS